MSWDEEALLLIDAAPPAVRPMIRQQIEEMASARGVERITTDFLMAAKGSFRHGGHGAKPQSAHAEAKHPADNRHAQPQAQANEHLLKYFARITGHPLTNAFPATDGVHVFSGGQPMTPTQTVDAWQISKNTKLTGPDKRCLYLHVPFCRGRCVFCPFYANKWAADASGAYADSLIKEIQQLGNTPLGQSELHTVYFGGGTPSDLAPADLSRILTAIHNNLNIADDAEITLEGRIWGHTQQLTEAALRGGVNRFSLGVQSFDTRLRRSLGRRNTREEIISFVNQLASHHASVVIDLIYGLPGQTMQQWREDLRCLIEETQIHGVDLYRLKSVPGSVMDQMIGDGRLPARSTMAQAADMFVAGVEHMNASGWQRLSVSHWRRDPRERSLYNTIVKSGADCIPVGCGAGGRVGQTRYFQTSDLAAYHQTIAAGGKPVAMAIGLASDSGLIDRMSGQVEKTFIRSAEWADASTPLFQAVNAICDQWAQAGLLEKNGSSDYALTTAGQFWSTQMSSRLSQCIHTFIGGGHTSD